MAKSYPIDGILALLLFAVAAASMGLLPRSSAYATVGLLSGGASLLFAVLGLRSPRRHDRFCAKAVLVLVLVWVVAGLLVPVVSG